jgi:hypothetical protein
MRHGNGVRRGGGHGVMGAVRWRRQPLSEGGRPVVQNGRLTVGPTRFLYYP